MSDTKINWEEHVILGGVSPEARDLLVRLAELKSRLLERQEVLREERARDYYLQLFPAFADPRTKEGAFIIALLELLVERGVR